MSKELVISATRYETRVATLEDDQLVEIAIELAAEHAVAGNLYKGRVSRVLPGMQSAFVKIGLERDAFLYVSDVLDQTAEVESGALDDEHDDLAADSRPAPADEPEAPEPALDAGAAVPGAPADRPERRDEAGGDRRDEAGRDRRGRRGRRRRGRGEPAREESAPAPAAEPSMPRRRPVDDLVADETPRRPQPAPDDGDDFEVLPGESLAKYRREDRRDPFEPEPEPIEADEAEADWAIAREMIPAVLREEVEERLLADVRSPIFDDNETDAAAEEFDEPEPDDEADDDAVEFDEPEPDEADENDADSPALDTAAERAIEADEDAAGDDEEEPGAAGDGSEGEGAPSAGAESAEVRTRDDSRRLRRGRRGRRRRGGRPERDTPGAVAERVPAEDAPAPAAKPAADETQSSEEEDEAPRPSHANIADLLKAGQEVIVQVAKEPLGKKGARITSHVALPGRHLVYMPTVAHTGVSRKIASDSERARLRRIIKEHSEGIPGGFIVRTAGQGAAEEELVEDIRFLSNLWKTVNEKAARRPAPALLHQDLDVVERFLRDQLGQNYKTIWVDNEDYYERIVGFVERFQPELVDRVKLYTRSKPIFDEFKITPEIEKALRPKVWLKSGGYLVINQTEALVAVDVNTGKYVGKSDRLEDTIVKTNLEAVQELVRQLRLRDLGGIIVVDFIDMDDRSNRKKVAAALEQELRRDRAPTKALSFNDFGLVAITRKRVKQSLERALCSPCPTCDGSGFVKAAETVIFDILREARKLGRKFKDSKDVTLRVNPDVARVLKSRDNTYLQEIEESMGVNVLVRGDLSLHRENYDFNA